jgi:hypothetical protein
MTTHSTTELITTLRLTIFSIATLRIEDYCNTQYDGLSRDFYNNDTQHSNTQNKDTQDNGLNLDTLNRAYIC